MKKQRNHLFASALHVLRQGSIWTLRDGSEGTFAGLEWLDGTQAKPTEAEIDAEIKKQKDA